MCSISAFIVLLNCKFLLHQRSMTVEIINITGCCTQLPFTHESWGANGDRMESETRRRVFEFFLAYRIPVHQFPLADLDLGTVSQS